MTFPSTPEQCSLYYHHGMATDANHLIKMTFWFQYQFLCHLFQSSEVNILFIYKYILLILIYSIYIYMLSFIKWLFYISYLFYVYAYTYIDTYMYNTWRLGKPVVK